MEVNGLDHLVLTVKDIKTTSEFYNNVLGAKIVTFGDNRTGLIIGRQKINLHRSGQEINPCAKHPVPGSADLCFTTDKKIADVIDHLANWNVSVEIGPVPREGALGQMESVYFRDPDLNLIEVSHYNSKSN